MALGRVARLLSGGAGFIFKGPGFYQTDYKRSGFPGESASASGEKGSSAAADKTA